jgi:hypothetical protein
MGVGNMIKPELLEVIYEERRYDDEGRPSFAFRCRVLDRQKLEKFDDKLVRFDLDYASPWSDKKPPLCTLARIILKNEPEWKNVPFRLLHKNPDNGELRPSFERDMTLGWWASRTVSENDRTSARLVRWKPKPAGLVPRLIRSGV